MNSETIPERPKEFTLTRNGGGIQESNFLTLEGVFGEKFIE